MSNDFLGFSIDFLLIFYDFLGFSGNAWHCSQDVPTLSFMGWGGVGRSKRCQAISPCMEGGGGREPRPGTLHESKTKRSLAGRGFGLRQGALARRVGGGAATTTRAGAARKRALHEQKCAGSLPVALSTHCQSLGTPRQVLAYRIDTHLPARSRH